MRSRRLWEGAKEAAVLDGQDGDASSGQVVRGRPGTGLAAGDGAAALEQHRGDRGQTGSTDANDVAAEAPGIGTQLFLPRNAAGQGLFDRHVRMTTSGSAWRARGRELRLMRYTATAITAGVAMLIQFSANRPGRGCGVPDAVRCRPHYVDNTGQGWPDVRHRQRQFSHGWQHQPPDPKTIGCGQQRSGQTLLSSRLRASALAVPATGNPIGGSHQGGPDCQGGYRIRNQRNEFVTGDRQAERLQDGSPAAHGRGVQGKAFKAGLREPPCAKYKAQQAHDGDREFAACSAPPTGGEQDTGADNQRGESDSHGDAGRGRSG